MVETQEVPAEAIFDQFDDYLQLPQVSELINPLFIYEHDDEAKAFMDAERKLQWKKKKEKRKMGEPQQILIDPTPTEPTPIDTEFTDKPAVEPGKKTFTHKGITYSVNYSPEVEPEELSAELPENIPSSVRTRVYNTGLAMHIANNAGGTIRESKVILPPEEIEDGELRYKRTLAGDPTTPILDSQSPEAILEYFASQENGEELKDQYLESLGIQKKKMIEVSSRISRVRNNHVKFQMIRWLDAWRNNSDIQITLQVNTDQKLERIKISSEQYGSISVPHIAWVEALGGTYEGKVLVTSRETNEPLNLSLKNAQDFFQKLSINGKSHDQIIMGVEEISRRN